MLPQIRDGKGRLRPKWKQRLFCVFEEREDCTMRIAIGVFLLLLTFCLYCCLRVGSEEDDWMEEHMRKRADEKEG